MKAVDKPELAEAVSGIRVTFPQASDTAIDKALRVLRKGNRAKGGA